MYDFRIYILFLITLLIACNEDKEKKVSNNEIKQSVSTKQDTDLKKVIITKNTTEAKVDEKEYDKPRVHLNKEINLSKEVLITYLPAMVPEFQTITPTTGSIQQDDSVVIVTAKGQYILKGTKSSVLIDINDYGRKAENILAERYLKLPKEPGAFFEPILETGIKGYVKWLDANQSGIIKLTVNNRFEIIIRVDKSTIEKLKSYINLIDLNKIKSIK